MGGEGRPTKGKGRGDQVWGRGGGWQPIKGKRGRGRPLGFLCGRKETMPQMTLT
jgi:hypothetical protein